MVSGVAYGGTFDADGTGEDQRFQPRARQLPKARREHAIEPGRSLVAADRDFKPLTAIRQRALFQRLSLMTETVVPEPTPRAGRTFCAGPADDADRGPYHGAGG